MSALLEYTEQLLSLRNEVYHERNIPSWCAAEAQCTTIQNQPFHKLHDMGGTNKGLDNFFQKIKVGCIHLFANKSDLNTNPPGPSVSSVSNRAQQNNGYRIHDM